MLFLLHIYGFDLETVGREKQKKDGETMARYAIIRVRKFTMSDVQGIQKHNQRQGKSKSNLDIDYERSHLNVDLLNEQNLRYERIIKDEIDERVKRKPRANSVVLSEFLVTASPEYMQSLSADEQKSYFERSLDFIKERYGEQNTLYAVVHMDEANPHMHVGIVPITEDGRLSAKDIYNRTELRALQNEFPAEMQRQGFEVERGEEGSKEKHLHPNEYKEKKDLEKEVQLLEENIDGKKKEFLALSDNLSERKLALKTKKEIKTEVKVRLIGKPEIIEKETGNYVLTPKQVEKMEELITAAVAVKKDYNRLQSTDLVKENKELNKAFQIVQQENKELKEENQSLKFINRDLKARIADLTVEIKNVYKSTKEFLKERTEDARGFKSAFKDLMDMIKGKTKSSEFEKVYKRDQNREREKGLER